jgi:hypothetical protein
MTLSEPKNLIEKFRKQAFVVVKDVVMAHTDVAGRW